MILPLVLFACLIVVMIAGFITRNSLRIEIIRLRLELASATSARDGLAKAYEGMREIAAKAIDAARTSAYKGEATVVYRDFQLEDVLPDPDPCSVKFCNQCNVSVRGDSWPIPCPNCETLIGDVLDADEIG